LFHLAMKHCNF